MTTSVQYIPPDNLGQQHCNVKCDVSYWKFAGTVIIGNIAGLAGGALARRLTENETRATREAMASFTHLAAFWLAGGIAWFLFTRGVRD